MRFSAPSAVSSAARQSSLGTAVWTWSAVLVSILLGVAIAWLHFRQRQVMIRTVRLLEEVRQARIDLAQGFLQISLGDQGGLPFTRAQGLAMLEQASRTLEIASKTGDADGFIDAEEARALAAYQASAARFRQLLDVWQPGSKPDLKAETDLRLTFHQLEQLADEIDTKSQLDLKRLSSRLDLQFGLILTCASLLLLAICITVFIKERAQAEAHSVLFQNQSSLRALLDHIPDWVWLKNAESRYITANTRYAQAVGHSPESLAGCADADLWPAALAQQYVASDQGVIRQGQPLHLPEKVTGRDGKDHWFDTIKAPVRDKKGGILGTVGIARDVTAAVEAERRIQRLNRVYAVLSEINHTIVRERDPTSMFTAACRIATEKGGFRLAWIGLPDATLKRVNLVAHSGADATTVAVLTRILEDPAGGCSISLEALESGACAICNDIGRDPRSVSWREAALAREYHAMASLPLKVAREPVGIFNLYASEAGFFDEEEVRLLDKLAMNISFALEVHRQETERQRAQEERSRLAIAVEQAAEVIMITDACATILYVNPAFETVTGYTREEATGRNPRFLKSGRHDLAFYRQMWGTLTRGEVWKGRLINRRKDGRQYEEETTISPIRDAAGGIVNYVAVKRDVTQEVALEDQLRRAQKMDALGQLAGGVAHDFNNILTAILMQLGLLEVNADLPEEVRAALRDLSSQAQRAANLTRQLLLFSRRQIMQVRLLDLNEILNNMVKMLRRVLGEHINLEYTGGDTPRYVEADAGMIEQIVMNLCVNARDAMTEGGRLTIGTEQIDVRKRQKRPHPEARAGRFVCLSVSDTGCGMDSATLQRIFEPFFTTKEVGKGTGLGLATVHGIVKQHQGWIEVKSAVGQGSTFCVFLPAAESPEDLPAPRSERSVAPRGSETILVVEDDAAVRETTTKSLSHLGYRILTATTGKEALRLFEEARDTTDLVLSDIVMPGNLSGLELADRLRSLKPDVKIILCSGYSLELATHGKATPPEVKILAKPFNVLQLAHALRQALGQH